MGLWSQYAHAVTMISNNEKNLCEHECATSRKFLLRKARVKSKINFKQLIYIINCKVATSHFI